MTDINGKSWPEEEIVHFDIDCGRKEEVVEVGPYIDLGHRDTLYVRTNHGREKRFTRNYDVRADGHCKVPIVPKAVTALTRQIRRSMSCELKFSWSGRTMIRGYPYPSSNMVSFRAFIVSRRVIWTGVLDPSVTTVLFESVNMVGNSRRDYRCAVCGAPFRRPKIAKSSKSRDKAAGTQAPEEEYKGLDPAFFSHRSLDWLSEARVIGTHSHEGIGLNRAFVSEPDGIYDALYELSHNHDALALNLDYEIKIDNTFQNVFVPGIIAVDPNARLFRMSSSMEEKIEKRYWDDPLLSTVLEPAEASSTEVFRSLPPEIVFYIISFMDLRSIFRSLKASPAIYELISNNFNFWKRQLTNHFPWYNDL
ncbi:unnamed protein product [Colletotrichum noveboracense]|uniref:F-box domain-containing protein n=1 Tax=Colletotrichum noveboracense TaxID=2664923 RepID=A0A9W4RH66_9PEZI|nr:unnamed protein product [Colletotrichum noveboracense]